MIVKKVSRMSATQSSSQTCDYIHDESNPSNEQIIRRSSLVPEASPRKTSSFTIILNAPKVKSAIYTMACIVASYLISNTLHLILTVLER